MTISVPASASDMTPEWLNAHLPPSLLDGARVTGVSVEQLGFGEGFTGALARLTATTDPPNALRPLVAKLATSHGTTRDLMIEAGGYEKEVRFYRELASRVALPTPACHVAEIDPATGGFVLVLEDMSPAKVGNQVAGASLEQAELVADRLAAFHAGWWNSEELAGQRWLLPPEGFAARFLELADEGMPALHDLWGAGYPELVELVGRARRLMPDLLRRFLSGPPPKPYTLVHGDVRLDNMFFPADGQGRFAVIDWQGTALGPAANDLAYWTVLNLPVELRRRHEEALLRRYHAGLFRHGVRGYSLGRLRRDYRNSAVVLVGGAPVLAANLDLSSERGQALMAAAAERVDAAMRDFKAKRVVFILPWILRAMDAWDLLRRPFRRAP